MSKHLKVYINITIGVLLIALAYYFLFLPQNIVVGGVTGITIILNKLFNSEMFSSGLSIFVLNILFLIIGLFFLGKEFFIKTLYGSILLPLVISLFEFLKLPFDFLFTLDQEIFGVTTAEMNPISQIILSVLLGSILTGIGLGLCFRINATTGGMDIVQKIIAKYFHFPYSKTVYFTDGIVVFVDLIHMGGASRRCVFILSKKNAEIKQVIIEKLGRGVTVVPAYGGYSGEGYDMLVCTLNRNESYLLKDYICEIDPLAFTFFVSAKEVYGDGFEK